MIYTEYHGLLRKEDRIILLCARTEINDKIRSEIRSLIDENIDWDFILKRSLEHGLSPLLYKQLNLICPDLVPEAFMDVFKDIFHRNTKSNLLMLGELLKILELLKSHDITAIPYKGPLLAIQFYGNLAFRLFDDLDIFVKKEDVLKVKKLLISQGYKPYIQMEGWHEKFYLKTQREYKFINLNSECIVEIQWKFYGGSFSFSGDTSFLENPRNLQTMKINRQDILTLLPEDMLLVLCIHASGHLWKRLAWIVDVSELIGSANLRWDYLMEKSAEIGVKRILMINLLLAVDLLDLDLPEKILEPIQSDQVLLDLVYKIEKILFGGDSSSLLKNTNLRLSIREKRSLSLKDLFRAFLLPNEVEWEKNGISIYLFPLLYFFRRITVFKRGKNI